MKKTILLLICLMVLSTSIVSFGTEVNEECKNQKSLSLSGFAYDSNGQSIDKTDNYNVNLTYIKINEDEIQLRLGKNNVMNKSKIIRLVKSSEALYYCIEPDGTTYNFEFLENGNVILDIIKNGKVYAFGKNRRYSIEQYIQSLMGEKENPTISTRYAGGSVKTKSNSKVYTKMVWNPTRSNRLAIRVNTQGSQVATTVQVITVKGTVPSGYIVKSMNPTGANSSGALLSYIINNATKYVALPSIPVAPVSSCNGRSFSWTVNSLSTSWNKLNDTSDSGNPDNPGKGMMFYLYLDNNTTKNPAPTGTISIRYRITATGTFDATLSY